MNFETNANKLDMSYDFCFKHNMHAVDCRLNALINKNKILNNKLGRSKRHPVIRFFSHVPFKNYLMYMTNITDDCDIITD